jgi:hypothetical protein
MIATYRLLHKEMTLFSLIQCGGPWTIENWAAPTTCVGGALHRLQLTKTTCSLQSRLVVIELSTLSVCRRGGKMTRSEDLYSS